ncbi:MAG: RNA 2',3'-cyclic phosphodiesterase [Phycisphaera sp.]|nr:RNA 2',3'-cyclic phosphodiesterase [Phycisphaera sp.]
MPDYHVKRCFVAIWPDDVVRADLDDLTDAIEIPGMRATPGDQRHITVKFLGDVEDPKLPGVIDAVRRAAEGVGVFDVEVTGVTYLPDRRRPRAFAATIAPCAPLQRLFNQMEDAMAAVGFRREGRAYHPHITLGRFKKPRGGGRVRGRHQPVVASGDLPGVNELDLAATGFTADRVLLIQSSLDSTGPTYTPLAEVPLG